MNNLITSFFRLTVPSKPQLCKNISTTTINWLKVSPCLMAEPLKKKRRIDPAVVKAREDRKKKKIEKQIRRLERNAKQLKPLDENEIPLVLIDERNLRLRKNPSMSADELESRVLLEKSWAKFKREQRLADLKMLDRIAFSQQKALDELRKESVELYEEAIQIDTNLLPFSAKGPVNTPRIKDFDSPDGDYNDVSKKWE